MGGRLVGEIPRKFLAIPSQYFWFFPYKYHTLVDGKSQLKQTQTQRKYIKTNTKKKKMFGSGGEHDI